MDPSFSGRSPNLQITRLFSGSCFFGSKVEVQTEPGHPGIGHCCFSKRSCRNTSIVRCHCVEDLVDHHRNHADLGLSFDPNPFASLVVVNKTSLATSTYCWVPRDEHKKDPKSGDKGGPSPYLTSKDQHFSGDVKKKIR